MSSDPRMSLFDGEDEIESMGQYVDDAATPRFRCQHRKLKTLRCPACGRTANEIALEDGK